MAAFFWHCSGLIELALPTVGLAFSGQEVPGAHSLNTHTALQTPARTAPPKLSPHTQT